MSGDLRDLRFRWSAIQETWTTTHSLGLSSRLCSRQGFATVAIGVNRRAPAAALLVFGPLRTSPSQRPTTIVADSFLSFTFPPAPERVRPSESAALQGLDHLPGWLASFETAALSGLLAPRPRTVGSTPLAVWLIVSPHLQDRVARACQRMVRQRWNTYRSPTARVSVRPGIQIGRAHV